MAVLVTGGKGFIGKNLLRCFDENNISWVATSRYSFEDSYLYLDLSNDETIESIDFSCIRTVVHLASLAHSPGATEGDLLAINYEGTKTLINQAKKNGVQHFIFISSIGVNGLGKNKSYRFDDKPEPQEKYAQSKLDAEMALKEFCSDGSMGFTIIRPPLVFGKDAPGNFATLLKVAVKNYPMPFGKIENRRSFVYVDNLVNLILHCIRNPSKSLGQTFLVSDDYDLSTTELLKKIIVASGQSPRLLPVPVGVLLLMASLCGKRTIIERLTRDLTVNIEHTKSTLDWEPPISVDEGLRRCFDVRDRHCNPPDN